VNQSPRRGCTMRKQDFFILVETGTLKRSKQFVKAVIFSHLILALRFFTCMIAASRGYIGFPKAILMYEYRKFGTTGD
jgi:hypothetical protein